MLWSQQTAFDCLQEKDKEGQKIDFWQSFYKMVTTLIDLEKGYTNFAFLATKTIFTKKEVGQIPPIF